jgi:hypothetical protein
VARAVTRWQAHVEGGGAPCPPSAWASFLEAACRLAAHRCPSAPSCCPARAPSRAEIWRASTPARVDPAASQRSARPIDQLAIGRKGSPPPPSAQKLLGLFPQAGRPLYVSARWRSDRRFSQSGLRAWAAWCRGRSASEPWRAPSQCPPCPGADQPARLRATPPPSAFC